MPENRMSQTLVPTPREPVGGPRPTVRARLEARLRAGRFDRMVAVGVPATPGSALAVHYGRLTATSERQTIARTLRRIVCGAQSPGPFMGSRVPLHVPNIAAATEVIDTITARLHAPRPVGARGMARLRALLADGAGPLYRYGRGDLVGRLGAALAEL